MEIELRRKKFDIDEHGGKYMQDEMKKKGEGEMLRSRWQLLQTLLRQSTRTTDFSIHRCHIDYQFLKKFSLKFHTNFLHFSVFRINDKYKH